MQALSSSGRSPIRFDLKRETNNVPQKNEKILDDLRRSTLSSAEFVRGVVSLQAPARRTIDVHHHFEPSAKNADGTSWTIEAALAQLDANAVATAIGYGGPILTTDVSAGRTTSRRVNEWSTDLCREHAGRFGLFASIPMNDVDGALAEIAYAFDVLKADGIGIAPAYDGLWLGNAKFRPIFEELNRRRAVVYVHPAARTGCDDASLGDENGLIQAAWIEFPTDTARTILSLWAAGTTRDLPDVRFIFCHGGGVMPILLGRIAGFVGWANVGPEKLRRLFPAGVYAEFAKFYFDLAQAYAPETFAMLRSIVPTSQLLYGSDFSYFAISHSMELFCELELSAGERRMIGGDNAAAILPRWNDGVRGSAS